MLDEQKAVWRPVEVAAGSEVLVFGWCANVRSNDRVPAALHRVVDAAAGPDGVVPRRLSAVFFLAPAPNTVLEPKLVPGEVTEVFSRYFHCREHCRHKSCGINSPF